MQVKLTEYIKHSDNIYRVDTKAKCPDDQIVHERITCFQVSSITLKYPDNQIVHESINLFSCKFKYTCIYLAKYIGVQQYTGIPVIAILWKIISYHDTILAYQFSTIRFWWTQLFTTDIGFIMLRSDSIYFTCCKFKMLLA